MEVLKKGTKGYFVEKLQEFLKLVGFPTQVVNGDYDDATLANVLAYQKQKALAADGIVGAQTMLALVKQIKGIKEEDFVRVATDMKVEVPAIKSVHMVEAGGFGFNVDGRPKILFEGHKFWAALVKKGIDPAPLAAKNPDIIYPKWTKEFYSKDNFEEWKRMERAMAIDKDAAMLSASYGSFQIMGFNYASCGYKTVQEFVDSQSKNEGNHLADFAKFVANNGMLKALQEKDWATFAKKYNGPAYAENKYDIKLRDAYIKNGGKA
ncbi:MAG TPA: hypothetical protein DCQ31_06820 [Bacteroidales bacterium]|nr:hypothetical protein [Bacteroidales bacterium]